MLRRHRPDAAGSQLFTDEAMNELK